jgi:hypothetical protein
MTIGYKDVSEYQPSHTEALRDIILVVKGIMQGKTNNVGTITLSANTTSTTVTLAAARLGVDTHISLTATTASAQTAAGAGMYVTKDVANSQFTITHNNTVDADKTFTYALIG